MSARTLLALLAFAFAANLQAGERFTKGILWRVAKAGVAPSYVYGTMHVADARLAELPPPARQAFDRARSLTVEYVAGDYGRERFLEAAMFYDRQTLGDKIGPEDFARVLEALAPIGLTREFINKLKPWGVLLNLRSPRPAEGLSPDAQLHALARARRMPVHPMEEVEEQVFVFDEFPMDSQIVLLRHALAHQDELVAMGEQTLQAYLARDLARLWRIQQEFIARHPQIASHHAAFTKRVVTDRSVVMAFRMQRQVRKGSAFVALGVMHLYGPQGVLALLERDGYRLKRLY